jgi:hypothetical protein
MDKFRCHECESRVEECKCKCDSCGAGEKCLGDGSLSFNGTVGDHCEGCKEGFCIPCWEDRRDFKTCFHGHWCNACDCSQC